MSADDEDNGITPQISTQPRVNSVTSQGMLGGGGPSRYEFDGFDDFREDFWMDQYGGKRSLYDALGYVKDPDYEHFRARYETTDTASALVDKLPKKAWSLPKIIDTDAEDTSEFEEHINRLLAGEYTEDDPINVMERASRMERLGHFALIFIGFNDDGAQPSENDEGVDLLENEVDADSLESQDPSEAISYLTPYDEGRCDLDQLSFFREDPTHPRYGKPKMYDVDLGDFHSSADIHWSRLLHVVGNKFDNELQTPSVLRQSLNRIDDIEKILGGSAEGFWRAAYTGLVISPPTVNGQMTEFSDSGSALEKQIDRYINNMSREIFTQGDIETIDVTVEDPTGHLESEYRALSTGHDIPQSILMGNETGERATSEDRQMWHERVQEFREEYCFPAILAPFIDRLIEMNVIPEPEGGRYAYEVDWPTLDAPTEQEEWDIAQTKSSAISTGTGGNPLAVVSPQEYRQEVLGWGPERGSEVEGDVEMEDLDFDEEDPRVQEQFRSNSIDVEEIESILDQDDPDNAGKLKVDTPDGRGVIIEVLRSGFEEEEASVEASDDDPKFVVVLENEDNPWGFYAPDEVDQDEWNTDLDDPAAELEEDGRANKVRTIERVLAALPGRENVAGDGRFTWPESWRESDKPARLIALDAWVSMGGSVSGCIREMRGNVADPGRFCADFADRLYQWDYWRGDSWAPGE